MDRVKALAWEADLKGKPVAGYVISHLIDFGKSAAVFKATREGEIVALKIFDDELIERYGDKTQLARIDRELTLVGKIHPNMVKILDGGIDPQTKNHFIVMAYVTGDNLEKSLHKIPEANVPILIEQLASACKFLEENALAHRDIKPANIVVTDNFSRLILLDFGVLKPVGEVGLTDADGIQSFVGTLQYSSPEFLLRNEEDTTEGWRALSLYQIGGVLHDLIMRKPLFQDYVNPYGRLVMAVQNDLPTIASSTLPSYLVETCKAALIKCPNTRLKLVNWDSFSPPPKTDIGAAARERVTRRSVVNDAIGPVAVSSVDEPSQLTDAVIELIKVEARRVRNSNIGAFPPLTITRANQTSNVVTVGLRAAAQQGLPFGAAMEICVEVLDPAAQAIIVKACAWRGGALQKPSVHEQIQGFSGIFAPTAISGFLESLMYLTVDEAQASPGSSGEAINLQCMEAVA